MKRYAEYKDSGIEWIGKIPLGWKIIKIKYVTSKIGSGKTPRGGNEVYVDQGIIFLRSQNVYNEGLLLEDVAFITEEMDEELSNTRLEKNDILLNITGASIGRSCIWNEDNQANVNQHVCIIRINENIQSGYLRYVLISKIGQTAIELYQTGANREGLNFEQIANIQIPYTTLPTQNNIIKYLDDKCSIINDLLMEKSKFIDLLVELRQSKISEAVTKGLNTNIKMKNSGIDWIGDIPEHWEITRIKNLFQLVDHRNLDDENALLLSLFTAIGVRPRSEMEERGNKAQTVMNYKKVECGDLIVNKLLAWMGAIAFSEYDGVTSPDYDVYRPRQGKAVCKDYYHHYFRDTNFKGDCFKYGHGIMMMRWRTYSDEFMNISVIHPPESEQIEIAQFVKNTYIKAQTTIELLEQQIEKLKEYRQSIISEVVTGKVAI